MMMIDMKIDEINDGDVMIDISKDEMINHMME
jgi:hypothetical protein